jgi:multidrug efflux pump subunit AcrA (membrane-fusion protein)
MSSILYRLSRSPTQDVTRSVSRAKVGGVMAGLGFAAALGGFFAGARPPRLEHRAIGPTAAVDALQVPRWSKLELETATLATGAWLDPVASRVRPDESRVASIGVPLAGRVTQVYAELGQSVAKGTPLLAVAGIGFAQLSGEEARAKLDVSASQVTLARVQAIVESGALPARDAVTAAAELRSAKLGLTAAEQELASLAVTRQTDNEFVI